jgi:hypothetical protein
MNEEKTMVTIPTGYVAVAIERYSEMLSENARLAAYNAFLQERMEEAARMEAKLASFHDFFIAEPYAKTLYNDYIHNQTIDVEKEAPDAAPEES